MNIKEESKCQMAVMYQNIRYLREQRGWSFKELSEISGINENMLVNIENGKDFGLQYLIKLCRVYHIKPHEIFLPIKNNSAV